jgi:hypothetical protein
MTLKPDLKITWSFGAYARLKLKKYLIFPEIAMVRAIKPFMTGFTPYRSKLVCL